MREFFRPLRRKIGVLTLVVACLLTSAWVRSLKTIDSFSTVRGWNGYKWESVDGRVELRVIDLKKISISRGFESQPLGRRRLIHEAIAKLIKEAKQRLQDLQQSKESLTPSEFQEQESTAKRILRELQGTLPFCAVPYWSIVIPLILLSFWLMLSTPPAKKLLVNVPVPS